MKDLIEKLLKYDLAEMFVDDTKAAEFKKGVKEVLGTDICVTCPGQVTEAKKALQIKLTKKPVEIKGDYKLNRYSDMNLPKFGKINHVNCTPEIAREIMTKWPHLVVFFEPITADVKPGDAKTKVKEDGK